MAAKPHDRWSVLRDMIVFQFKLVVDGLLDLLLLPASLVFGLVSFAQGGAKAGAGFYKLMRWGRRGERWINLFGATDRRQDSEPGIAEPASGDLDDLVVRVESFLVDECRRRGVTTQTRQRLDAALETLQSLRKQRPPNEPQ